jgi:hypothetical protein
MMFSPLVTYGLVRLLVVEIGTAVLLVLDDNAQLLRNRLHLLAHQHLVSMVIQMSIQWSKNATSLPTFPGGVRRNPQRQRSVSARCAHHPQP